MSSNSLSRRTICVLLVAALAGCGSDDEVPTVKPLEGVVRINGEPADGAFITLYPVDDAVRLDEIGSKPWGRAAPDGTFLISTYHNEDGAPPGQYRIGLIWFESPNATPPGPDRLRGRYANPAQSGLALEVRDGEHVLPPIDVQIDKLTDDSKRHSTQPADPRE